MTKENSIALLGTCKRNPTIVRATQYTTSQQLAKANYQFGIPTAVLSAVLGTAILATIPESVNTNLKIAAGLVSLLTAALASIHTLLRLEERAEKHRKTGARCAALIREIDETLAYSEKGRNIPRDSVKSIRERYDEVSLDAPPTSQRALNKALKIIELTDAKSKKNDQILERAETSSCQLTSKNSKIDSGMPRTSFGRICLSNRRRIPCLCRD